MVFGSWVTLLYIYPISLCVLVIVYVSFNYFQASWRQRPCYKFLAVHGMGPKYLHTEWVNDEWI